MCGVSGYLMLNGMPACAAVATRMGLALAHRGPDDQGIFTDGPVALAHRRLSILDLTPAGHQPMSSADGRYVISYNGELYNFQEMRTELQALGCNFQTRSDTEVLLAAWVQWGVKALDRFNGMFAFAIWDRSERMLTLARDRFGVKPLYYAQVGNAFLFGSEIKAILAHGAYRTVLDKEALLEYLTFQNFFTDRTLFKDVRLLPAGCHLAVGADAQMGALVRYWDYHFREPERAANEAEYVEELDRLFRQAVSRQLVSDVDVGAYLSGGMDSGSITALAAMQLPYIKTFTTGFDLSSASGVELGFDEREKAERLSYLFKTEHYEMVLKAGDMERVMPRLTRHLEEPRVGQSYPNFYTAQLASKFVKVVLGGTGGDELFGGYPWRYYRAVVNDDFEHYIDKYYDFWHRLIPNKAIQEVFKPIWSDVKQVCTRDIFRDVFTQHVNTLKTPEEYVNHSLYFEARTFLHGLLVVEDKLSMAHGLESRVPFLDNDLVEFAMQVPVRMKLGNLSEVMRIDENEPAPKTNKYFEKTRDGKLVLRKAMQRYIPNEVTQREKQGFSAPDASWFRGESIDYVRRRLGDSKSRIYEYLDERAIKELLAEHLDGRVNRRLFVWSMLSLDQWCDEFL